MCVFIILKKNPNFNFQLISLESVLELGRSSDHLKMSDNMRTLALSVFSQCRRYLTHTSNIKALTGFGTAAMTELFLKNKDVSIFYELCLNFKFSLNSSSILTYLKNVFCYRKKVEQHIKHTLLLLFWLVIEITKLAEQIVV